jgi:hypothetical protein
MNNKGINLMTKRYLILVLICLQQTKFIEAIFQSNIFNIDNNNNFDLTIDFPSKKQTLVQVGVYGAFHNVGHNSDGEHVDILQIWQPNQNSLTMLRGFPSDSPTGMLASLLNSANDDGVRGHILPSAKLTGERINFLVKHKLPFNLFFNLLIPIFNLKLSHVSLTDLTQNITFSDQLVKANLTNNLPQIVYNLGQQLDINHGWHKGGLGDIEIALAWSKNFKQPKPVLKNVMLGVYAGLSLPTGVRQDEDDLMPIPFGNDGSLALIFGGNIQLQWWNHLRGGITADFMEIFSNHRSRRIKTDNDQTDLFLLAKTDSIKDWGFTQQYGLYLETFNFYKAFALRAAYSYIKHNQDELNIFNQSYTSQIANTATSLEEWTQHSMVFSLFYDGEKNFGHLLYQRPFNGTRTIQSQIFGGELGFYF